MKTKEVLQILKIHRQTLSRYVKEGKIKVIRLPNKTYNYNDEDVYRLAGLDFKRKSVIYARVSTYKQKVDLANQEQTIEMFMNKNGIKVDKVYTDIKSGMTLDRKGFLSLLDDVQNNKIDKVYISYKDRLAQLSYELVVKLFNQNSTRIVIINEHKKIEEQELFEDLMQVVDSFSINMHSKKRLANRIIGTKDDTTES